MIHNVTLNNYRSVCNYCTIYIVLLIITFIIIIGSSYEFFNFYWLNPRKVEEKGDQLGHPCGFSKSVFFRETG